MKNNYGFGKQVSYGYSEAIDAVKSELQKEGFGILTQIDVAATMKIKLGKDLPPYMILGACNPPLAHRVLEADPSIGLLLPCNVVVRQDHHYHTHVEFMDPNAVLDLVDNPEVTAVAQQVRERLMRVMDALT
jgi:uncharacterized protein (DUF302 family)